MGDPHYITFDGLVHHFQGKYTYILVQTIPDLPDTLTQFSIEGMNYPFRRSRHITNLKEILVNVYNHTVRFRQNKQLVVSLSLIAEHRERPSLGLKHLWVKNVCFDEFKYLSNLYYNSSAIRQPQMRFSVCCMFFSL